MSAKIRATAIMAAAMLGAASLVACGDSSPASGAPDAAAGRAAAQKIIRQAHAVNPEARSGRIAVTVDLNVEGVPRYEDPIQITANGRFQLAGGASVPDFDFDVGLSLGDRALGGSLVLVGGTAYVKLGTVGYRIPDEITRTLVAPAAGERNGLTKTATMFHVNPHRWQRDARLTGESTVAGERVQEIDAGIRPERALLDLARLTRFLSRLGVTQALGLPTELGPELRAALARSVTRASGKVWMGREDHVLRKAQLAGSGVVAQRDRKLLFGATSASLEANVSVTDVGVEQEISAPKQLDSYSSLQLALSALGEAVRRGSRAAGR